MSQSRILRPTRAILGIFVRTYQDWQRIRAAKAGPQSEFREKIKKISVAWGQTMLAICGVETTVDPGSVPFCEEPCLFVCNHVSYMDIPLIMALFPAVFVAKKQVRHWAIIGPAASDVGMVFVDRNSPESKRLVSETLAHAIGVEGKSVVVFPEGTSSPYGKPWKRGAFAMAKENGFKVQAIRIAYDPHRLATYWARDVFVFHLWRLMSRGKIKAYIKLLPPQYIEDVDRDTRRLEQTIVQSLEEKLKEIGEPIDESARYNPAK